MEEEKNIKVRISNEWGESVYIQINKNQLNLLDWLYQKGFICTGVDYDIVNELDFTII